MFTLGESALVVMLIRLFLRMLCRGLLLAALSIGSLSYAAEANRLRIGLVLGGGGARGAAHIGVLELFAACVCASSRLLRVRPRATSSAPPVHTLAPMAPWTPRPLIHCAAV